MSYLRWSLGKRVVSVMHLLVKQTFKSPVSRGKVFSFSSCISLFKFLSCFIVYIKQVDTRYSSFVNLDRYLQRWINEESYLRLQTLPEPRNLTENIVKWSLIFSLYKRKTRNKPLWKVFFFVSLKSCKCPVMMKVVEVALQCFHLARCRSASGLSCSSSSSSRALSSRLFDRKWHYSLQARCLYSTITLITLSRTT